jgi:hypothetical protein
MAASQDRQYLSKQYTLKATNQMASAFYDSIILPGQVEEDLGAIHDDLLSSAISFVLGEYAMFSGLNDEEIQATDFKTLTLTIWWFPWDSEIENKGKRIFMRDVVNTPEFLYQIGQEESRRNSCFCTVHPLERDTKVGEAGTVIADTAVLNATFSKDGPCDECGKHSKNGRATCLCPFDKDDIRKMDVALMRQ